MHFRPKISMMFVPTTAEIIGFSMFGTRRIAMVVMAGSLLLPLGACTRTSDGTIVVEKPIALPSLSLMPVKPLVPSWMRKKPEPDPAAVAANFPPPPAKKTAPRRKVRPPVVTTSSGNLACQNVSEGGRVRMVCK
jgi:hypothetical protein